MPASPLERTRAASPAALTLAALAGASFWLTLGEIALVDPDTMRRVGVLPPVWVLPLLVGVSLVLARWCRSASTHLWPLALTVLVWLPWLPVPVPTVFLLFTGPVVAVIWLVALTGVVTAHRPQMMARVAALGGHPRALMVATVLASAVYLIAAASVSSRVPTGDEPHYLVVAQSLLSDGDLRVENNYARGDYLAYYEGPLRPNYLRRGMDGEIYPVHLPGVSLLVLPVFALGGYPAAVALLALLMALGGVAVWRVASLAAGSTHAAWFAWAAVMLTTPIVAHAFMVYPDGPGAVAVAIGLLTLMRAETRGAGAVGRLELAVAGAALACLPWLHTRFALVAATLGPAILLRHLAQPDRGARVAAFLAVPVVTAAAWFAYFHVLYGTANPAAPYGGYTQTELRYALTGVPGLLFDQQFGLLACAPVYAVAVAGFIPLARSRPRLAVELAAIVVPYVIAVGSYAMWWGGYSAPARFLVVILPVLALPLAAAWEKWRGPAARALMGALLAVSVGVTMIVCGVDGGRLLHEGRTGHATWLQWASPTVSLPLALPAIHRGSVAVAMAQAAIWITALLLAAWGLSRRAAWQAASSGGRWAAAGAAGALAVMMAISLAWTAEGVSGGSHATSQMALLSRWSPRWQSLGLQLRPLEVLPASDAPSRLLLTSTLHAPDDQSVLLLIPRVPAGDYDLVVVPRGPLAGTLNVTVGREAFQIERWVLDGRAALQPGLRLSLPVQVHSIAIHPDEAARASLQQVMLQPRRVAHGPWQHEHAARAARYGSMRVFFLGDEAHPEDGGFWAPGRATTEVVIAPDEAARPVVYLHAGPLAVPVELRVGAWRWRAELGPWETQSVTLPSIRPGDTVRVTIVTDSGFVPFEHDPSNADDRYLGVWVEPR